MALFETLARRMRGPGDTLKVECLGCGRRTTFARAKAFEVFSPDACPSDVRRRVRCVACGRSGYARVWI